MAKVSHCLKKKKEASDQEHGARCGNVTSKANSCHSLATFVSQLSINFFKYWKILKCG